MDVFSLVKACFRRWWLILPLFAITAVVTVVQARGIKPTYSESAQIVVIPPSATPTSSASKTLVPVNPLGSVGTVEAILVSQMNSAQVAQTVAQTTGGAFSVGAQRSGGILVVSAAGSSGPQTSATLRAAIAQVPIQLASLQRTFKTSQVLYYESHLLNTDAGPVAAYAHRGRNITLVALAGVILSILLTVLVDFLLLQRSNLARHRHNEDASTEASPAGESTLMDGLADPGFPQSEHNGPVLREQSPPIEPEPSSTSG